MSKCKVRREYFNCYQLGETEKPGWVILAFDDKRIRKLDDENFLVMQDPDYPKELTVAKEGSYIVVIPMVKIEEHGKVCKDFYSLCNYTDFHIFFKTEEEVREVEAAISAAVANDEEIYKMPNWNF